MNDYPSNVKQKLNSIIADMSEHHWLFSNNPGHNFMRQHQGKLSFYDTMRLIIGMGKGTTNDEIIEDYNKPRLIDYKGYNHMHLNGFVDVINKAFLDIVIQPGQKPDERQAFHMMLDHFSPDNPQKYIVTADRGYESYDLLFHCELKNLNYVFRVKAPSSSKSLLSYYATELPDDLEEFDVTMKRYFTDKATKAMKDQSEVYRYINPSKNTPHFYELLDRDKRHLYFMQFRVVKIKTAENTYEYLITNLPPDEFSLEEIKELYHLRWGIETSFRELKYIFGTANFHSKKREFIEMEIWARILLYNFCSIITDHVAVNRKGKKHMLQVNYSVAYDACHYLLRLHGGEESPKIESLIEKNFLPIRPNRKYARQHRFRVPVSFLYRYA